MVFPGLCYGMSTKPAWIIQSIAAPTLLLHSSGDWLTNARHSKMLFNKAGANQPIALAFIKTVVHAEDMLTRDTEMIKKTFFDVLATWFKFIDENAVVDDKMQFNKAFTQRMNSAVESDQIYPVMEITELSRPTMHNQRGNIWTTQSEQNPAFITLQAVLNRDGDARQFVTIGGKKNQKILSQLQAGFAWADYDTQDSINPEAYLSLYHPFGSFLWARKLTYIHGMQRHDSRRILSADLAFLVVDFQLNYGTIRTPEKKDLQLYCTYPLIFSPNGNYFAGLTYSQFFDTSVAEKNFSAYIFYGPKIAHARIQLFTEYHFLKSKFSKNESQWRFGISINLNER
ncbi:MAG: hypothetical protein DWQ10_10960 [Calditrichaeota bacterium]|nr:MAG: hypothetical protein DWQ10_10960 [Calditrichota bacterium]